MRQGFPVAAHLHVAGQSRPSLELGLVRGGRRQNTRSPGARRRHGRRPYTMAPQSGRQRAGGMRQLDVGVAALTLARRRNRLASRLPRGGFQN
jgi:hypothetical protein